MAEPAREHRDRAARPGAPDAAASVWAAATGEEESGTGWPGTGPHDAHADEAAAPPLARRPGRPDPNIRDAGSDASWPAPWRPENYAPGREGRRPEQLGSELLSGVQRWLIKSSARTMRREIEGQVRKTLTGSREERGGADAWSTATTEPPPGTGEAPECAWCPICQAARRMREPGPGGLGSRFSGVSEAVSAAVQDAMGVLDGVLSRSAASHGDRPPADRPAGRKPADSARGQAERAADEPGDRG